MAKRFSSAKLWFPLLGVVLVTTTSARPQSSTDLGALNKQVEQLVRASKFPEATEVASRAVALAERQFGPDHMNVAQSLMNLAFLYQYQGKYDQAEPPYKRALAIKEEVLGPNHLDVALSQDVLAGLYRIERR
jgi:tetratricopeptide (TPR) repeat protein